MPYNGFMKKRNVLERLVEDYPDEEFLKMDGYDDCVIGMIENHDHVLVLVYDTEKVIRKNMKLCKSNYEDAYEYFEFNQLGSYVGKKTPMFLITPKS
jgi:hypothetical protein